MRLTRRQNEPVFFLYRRLKKALERSGKTRELSAKEFYVKPSVIKRNKKNRKRDRARSPKEPQKDSF